MAARHGLSEQEYSAIIEQMGREPNELELSLFGAMWSEHCSYKHTRHLLAALPSRGPKVIVGPGENAGVIDAGDGIGVVFKIESHNHPSAIEPFQGAATGVGGIVRDVLSLGAQPVALLNSLRLGDLAKEHNRWLLKQIVAGMAAYGNGLEVPTLAGEIYFDPCYDNNPLVNAMCIGLAPIAELKKGLASGVGNRVLLAGAPTGRVGIGGAAFASEELAQSSSPRPGQMQVGDPLAGKNLVAACLELSAAPQIIGIQDLGAAGLTSASSEMAFRGGCGIELELSRLPVAEPGLAPVELLLSESQERMLLVVEPKGVEQVQTIFRRHGLEAADIGRVIAGDELVLLWQGQRVGRIPAPALANGAPRRQPQLRPPTKLAQGWRDLPFPDCKQALLRLLASPNIANRAPLYRRFGALGGGGVMGPGASAGLLRIPGGQKGVAAAVDCNSSYCSLDPREGTKRAVAEAARNVACVGARPAAVTNCLNFPSPEQPEQYWALTESILGLAEACQELATPVVSGNISLYNEGGGVAIKPTPVIGMVGLIDDVTKACGIGLKPGQELALLGRIQPVLGGSEYLRLAGGSSGPAPAVDLCLEAAICRLLPEAIERGLVEAAQDVSEGGIAVCLATMALAGGQGIEIEPPTAERLDYWLFSESPGAVVVALQPDKLPALAAMAAAAAVPVKRIGVVKGQDYVVGQQMRLPLAQLAVAWAGDLPGVFGDA